MKYFLVLSILIALFVPSKAQRLKLSLNLSNGNTYYMVGSSNSKILQTVNGQENQISTIMTYKIAFKVIGTADSVYNMEVRYQYLDMNIQIGARTIVMDSRKHDSQDVPSSMIATMMNKPFSVLITRSGRIRSVSNVEKIIAGVFDNFPQVDATKKEQIKKQFLQSFGGNAFKSNLEMGTAIYPESAINVNDKWTENTKLESTVKANLHTVYQLTNAKGGTYQIHADGKMVTDKTTTVSQINGLPMQFNLIGTLTSDIKTDKITGWISECKSKQLMKGYVEILKNQKVPDGMRIPMSMGTEVVSTDK